MVDKLHKNPQRSREFPRLAHLNHRVTSPASKLYNCVAWAMSDEARRWWPDSMGQLYWPEKAPRLETIPAFVEAVGLFGFMPTISRVAEKNVEKIALFALHGVPTHLAKQTKKGKWSSKLGDAEDIEHTLDALEGPSYGYVAQVFSRSKPTK